ncbi:tetratricopeptide repeat protein [Sphingomonas sp. BN140010]|uniref:Tetratricopeptide repeat protein n=1 Tax=Sphingomonas arvum TaxID=2992113 RepID=A0ABT3JBG3_9SPHN|nr:tetratricopeptide repeat protein [Sphingomonas sp. BN140010]MCW3796400.1 tetratricopeptide repeat protein [Sphingomonas sp. BN140010]
MRTLLASAAFTLLLAGPAVAQRQPTPEQRVERLERQVRQIQGRVFPNGQPASTAGLADDPAASQVVVTALSNRLDNIERSLTQITRVNEENANRISTMEAELARLRADSDQRLRTLETAAPAAPAAGADTGGSRDTAPAATDRPRPAPATQASTAPVKTGDPNADAEAAYDVGYQLWQQKKYDQAIAALRAMTSSFPNHRRVSWANNLIGRSLLDKGDYRPAAEALLANYRGNPRGERAPDSLYYLGQALVGLKQSSQACKAYAELEEVYGDRMRPDLKTLLPGAKSRAGCR